MADQRRKVSVFWPTSNGQKDLPAGKVLVIGTPPLEQVKFNTAMTKLESFVRFREPSKEKKATITGIYGSSRCAAMVLAYYLFPDESRSIETCEVVKARMKTDYRKIARGEAVVVTLPDDTPGVLVNGEMKWHQYKKSSTWNVGYTGAATSLSDLERFIVCPTFRKELNEPILYVKVPYLQNQYVVLAGTSGVFRGIMEDDTIMIEALCIRGILEYGQSSVTDAGSAPIKVRITNPWREESQNTIRRGFYGIYDKDTIESESEEEEEPSVVDKAPTRMEEDPGEGALNSKRGRDDSDDEGTSSAFKKARIEDPESTDDEL